MEKKTKLYSVISYLTWVGWVIALVKSDKDDAMVRHHLNQALIINLLESVGAILIRIGGLFGMVGEVLDLVVLVFFVMGILRAFRLSDEPLPLIGYYRLLK